MNLDDITPLVLTYNEVANIERTLAGLAWAREIVVVDSGSTDGTVAAIERYSNIRLVQRPFDNHTAQWNFGLEQVETLWVLALDADYVCPESLETDLQNQNTCDDAYQVHFTYCIQGAPLRATLYPPRVVLFRSKRYRYRQDGHTQALEAGGSIGTLRSVILHDDRKPLSRWLADQTKYADLEAKKLLNTPDEQLAWKDRLRKKILWAPGLTLFYCLFYKRLLLDGWPGIYYTLQRVYAELVLSLKLVDARVRRTAERDSNNERQSSQNLTSPSVVPPAAKVRSPLEPSTSLAESIGEHLD